MLRPRPSRILCWFNHHDWDSEVSETAIFQRIDCKRCDQSVDGAKVREVKRVLPEGHWLLRRLP